MKLTFKPAPNYRSKQSTTGIMTDLTLCLLAVSLFGIIYYFMAYGTSMGLRVLMNFCATIAAWLVTEACWFKVMKKDVKEGILTSYGWVTALIITLISSANASAYALFISTVLAILFGKLVFGGFGQNIFNPAAFGEAILMSTFAATSADLLSGATPTVAYKGYGWISTADQLSDVIAQYGGLGKMFLGMYDSTVGSTCALLIIACLIFLIVRKDIDWQTPVFYIGSVFVISLLVGLVRGAGIQYALFNVLAGGVLFGGVFMTTDPVTSPVSIPGKILFAVGAASFTLIIRWKSNLSDGVLYSILLMNMLTPMIDRLMDGSQIKDSAKLVRNMVVGSCIFAAVALIVGFVAIQPKKAAAVPAEAVMALSDGTETVTGTEYTGVSEAVVVMTAGN